MNLQKSRRVVPGEKTRKNEAKKSRGLFVEAYAVAPAPSRDYYALQLFQKKFVWTRWRICHGPYATPTQRVVSLNDYKRDATLQHELTYIFGTDTTNLIDDLANEKWSLTSMPSNVLQKIFSYIGVSDILRLSQVCKRLSKECSSNELWKTICKKQWKILIHNDIEKAGLIGWKTIYLEKMRPKRYKLEPRHQGHYNHSHLYSKPMSQLSRFQSVSTLNTPDSRGLTAKSNLTMPKRVQELKKCDTAVRSSSEIFGKDFKVTSISTGKSTERTYTVVRGNAYQRNGELKLATEEKLPLTPRRHFKQLSSSTINLTSKTDKAKPSHPIYHKTSARVTMLSTANPNASSSSPVKSKITSIRTRSATAQSAQPTVNGKLKATERIRPNTGKPLTKN